jgi:hypothetical protein
MRTFPPRPQCHCSLRALRLVAGHMLYAMLSLIFEHSHVLFKAPVRLCLHLGMAPCCCHVRLQGGGAGRYCLLPDYSTYQPASPPGPHSRISSASDGSDCPYAHSGSGSHSPTASSSGSRTARSSCCGDGVVEIALVLRAPSAEGENGEGAGGQGRSSKAVGKEGQELL